jgi:polyhydroxyalkanoate synthesis regulator phasin
MPQPKQQAKRRRAQSGARSSQRRQPARRSPSAQTSSDESLRRALMALRDEIARSFTLTADRLQETFDDSVRRGRITRSDGERLAESLLDIVRTQRREVLTDLEAVLERTAAGVAEAAREASRRARSRAEATARTARRAPGAERALREVDRARRVTGLAGFPIAGYDQLTVSQVTSRLGDLGAPDLRKVRDYERRNANRKSVLGAIEKRLAS